MAFTPETLAKAKPYLDECRREAAMLIAKYPKDDIYATFPARTGLAAADGYTAQIAKAMADGNFSDASIARARKLLDRALAENEAQRAKYAAEPHIDWMFRAKTIDAWIRMPSGILRHVGALIPAGHADPVRCIDLLRQAKAELDRAPEAVKESSDYRPMMMSATKGLQILEDLMKRRENK